MDYRYCPLCGERLGEVAEGPDAGRPACPNGHFVHYDNPAVTVGAFIEDRGDFLVLQRAIEPHFARWDLPGGFVEAGEVPPDAILREVAEETGLDVTIRRIVGMYASVYGDSGRHTIDVIFLCAVRGGQFELSAESSNHQWSPLSRIPELAFPSERAALADLRRRAG